MNFSKIAYTYEGNEAKLLVAVFQPKLLELFK